MPIMNQKLVKDFFEAVEVDRAITKKQIEIETGIPILRDMIQYVLEDINTKDQAAKGTVDLKIKELDVTNMERKESLKKRLGDPDDTIDDRNIKLYLLKEDHSKFKQELVVIQDLCYKKGWFD